MQKKREKTAVSTRHRIEYIFFIAFVSLVRISPLFMFKLNQRLLLFIFKRIGKKYARTVLANLRIAFPQSSEEEQLRLRERIYRHFALIFIQVLYMFVKGKAGKVLQKIEVRNIENIERALDRGAGLIIFSGHFGNWELIPFILHRELGRPIFSIARAMNNPLVERKVRQFREFMGSKVVYKQNSIRVILKALEANEIVFLLIDHNAIAREAVFVDFFGQEVSAVTSAAGLHIKRDIPIVPLFLHYEADRIVLDISEEIRFQKAADPTEDIKNLTQQCTALIEKNIRRHPEQWFWFHDRWKTRPKKSARREQ